MTKRRRRGRLRRRLLVVLADAAVAQRQRGVSPGSPLDIVTTVALWAVAFCGTPARWALAWHRLRYRQAGTRDGAPPDFPPVLEREQPQAAATAVAELLSARLSGRQLAFALWDLRHRGQRPDAVYRRALGRLVRDEDGQVPCGGGPDEGAQTPWGAYQQSTLREEMAWWAVTRQAWRNDPTIRRMLTIKAVVWHAAVPSTPFYIEAVRPIDRVLAVVQHGAAHGIAPRERALALRDACTWPEWLDPAGQGALREALTGLSTAEVQDLALTSEDIQTVLGSPAPVARMWALTVAIPLQPLATRDECPPAPSPVRQYSGSDVVRVS